MFGMILPHKLCSGSLDHPLLSSFNALTMPIIIAILFLLIIFGPQWWVRYVLRKHQTHIESLDGTGGELALHLIERFALEGVTVIKGEADEDYYDPGKKIVCLSPEVHDGKSLTAVAVAAHEVGHAIQFCREEPVSRLRERYLSHAHRIKQFGITFLMISPIIGLILRVPHLALLTILIGLVTMIVSVLMHVAVLPEEYDASFNKALPILAEGYLSEEQLPKARQILKACALTYVAAAMADILNLWRWIRFIR
jgi:Zn-dependent membrane protease YugP